MAQDIMEQLKINKKAIADAEKVLGKIDELSGKFDINHHKSMMFLQKLNPDKSMFQRSFQEIHKMQNSEEHNANFGKKKSLVNNIAKKKTI